MSNGIPIIILDDDEQEEDDDDELQITGIAVCANHRINSDPGCAAGFSNPSDSKQTGNSPIGNGGIDGQQVVATRQTDGVGVAHPILASAAEWLQSSVPLEESSPYFPPPLPSPTNSLSTLGNPCEKNHIATPNAGNILAELTSASGQETSAKHPPLNLLFTRQFFTDMADTIAHIFPYGELASKYKCSVEQVNHALIAVVLDPLTKRSNGKGSCGNGNDDDDEEEEEEEEEHGQGYMENERGAPDFLMNGCKKTDQETVYELQGKSEGKGLTTEFEQTLVAASGNAEGYLKERNDAFIAYKAFRGARKNERGEAWTAVQGKEYKSLGEQLEEMAEAPGQEHPLSDTDTRTEAAIPVHEKGAKEDESTSSSRKRTRSSSETANGKEITGRDSTKSAPPSPPPTTSPALYQLPPPPPLKKAKTTVYPSTPTQTSTAASATGTTSLRHSNPKHLVVTDLSIDTYKLNFFSNSYNNNTDNRSTPSPYSSGSSSTSQAPTAQTPTPLPRPKPLPHITTNPVPYPNNSHPRPSAATSYFTRSARRHLVTIDKFGNYQRVQQNQSQRRYSTLPSHKSNKNNTALLPCFNGLLRRRAVVVKEHPPDTADSGAQCDFHDPYCNAGADLTTRVFTEGLRGELFVGFREEEGRRKLVGLEFGLEQIGLGGQGKWKVKG
ncbi:hypothetical protein AJ78_00854 [Emergomyces pasteurianus Ep9510]|uniref:Uncharacterized protein n=1 Tax=Emergomyces pasteurianus Ep9510 TaxID=1447872 RepID=A0A1J9PTC2_9EURO|nr:hypothetical protein AJ78_00854 [Emergomyces pasteurianus Ep9510]